LRLVQGFEWKDLWARVEAEQRDTLRDRLMELAGDGLIVVDKDFVAPTRRGLLLLNQIGIRLLGNDGPRESWAMPDETAAGT